MSVHAQSAIQARSSWDCDTVITTDPDVSGIGVLLSFVGAGILIVLLLTVHYLVVYDPTLDPFRTIEQPDAKTTQPNAIDVAFLRHFRACMTHFGCTFTWLDDARNTKSLRDTFDKCVLAMSDVQIITGLAILISGLHGLFGSLSGYQWLIITYTAWFSAVTHLGALSHLRNFYINRMDQCIWRLALMLVVLIMLSATMVIGIPTRANLDGGHMPAICLLTEWASPDSAKEVTYSTVLSILMMTFGYASRVLKMGQRTSARFLKFRNRWRGKLIKAVLWNKGPSSSFIASTGYKIFVAKPLTAAWLYGRAYLELFKSFFAELFWLVITASWGLSHLLTYRRAAAETETDPDALEIRQSSQTLSVQDTWGFGQVTAVILFASPIFLIVEAFFSLGREEPSSLVRNPIEITLPSSPAESRRIPVEVSDEAVSELGTASDAEIRELASILQNTLQMSSVTTQLSLFVIAIFNVVLGSLMFVSTFSQTASTPDPQILQMIRTLAAWYLWYQFHLIHLIFLIGFEIELRMKHNGFNIWVGALILLPLAVFSYMMVIIIYGPDMEPFQIGFDGVAFFSISFSVMLLLFSGYFLYCIISISLAVFSPLKDSLNAILTSDTRSS